MSRLRINALARRAYRRRKWLKQLLKTAEDKAQIETHVEPCAECKSTQLCERDCSVAPWNQESPMKTAIEKIRESINNEARKYRRRLFAIESFHSLGTEDEIKSALELLKDEGVLSRDDKLCCGDEGHVIWANDSREPRPVPTPMCRECEDPFDEDSEESYWTSTYTLVKMPPTPEEILEATVARLTDQTSDFAVRLRKLVDPTDANHWNVDGTMGEVERLKAAVEAFREYYAAGYHEPSQAAALVKLRALGEATERKGWEKA